MTPTQRRMNTLKIKALHTLLSPEGEASSMPMHVYCQLPESTGYTERAFMHMLNTIFVDHQQMMSTWAPDLVLFETDLTRTTDPYTPVFNLFLLDRTLERVFWYQSELGNYQNTYRVLLDNDDRFEAFCDTIGERYGIRAPSIFDTVL